MREYLVNGHKYLITQETLGTYELETHTAIVSLATVSVFNEAGIRVFAKDFLVQTDKDMRIQLQTSLLLLNTDEGLILANDMFQLALLMLPTKNI